MSEKYIRIWSTGGIEDIDILKCCQNVLRNPRKHKHTIFDMGAVFGEKVGIIVQQEKNGVSGRIMRDE